MTGVGSLPAEGSKKKTASEDAAFSAGEGTRTHTHEAPDPKSGLSTNFNTPATRIAKVRKLADNANTNIRRYLPMSAL